MSREIRRVPEGWEHPTGDDGYIPMFDGSYADAAEDWLRRLMAWESGEDKDREHAKDRHSGEAVRYFWDWHDGPPDRHTYRPEFTSEATHYQVYEAVSEGTPVSPVFPDVGSLRVWLLGQGHTEKAADLFIKGGYAPTMIFHGGGVRMGIDSLDFTP